MTITATTLAIWAVCGAAGVFIGIVGGDQGWSLPKTIALSIALSLVITIGGLAIQ